MRINLSRSGLSTSIGTRGAHVNFSKRGTRTTLSAPGTGISYTTTSHHKHAQPLQQAQINPAPNVDLNAKGSAMRGWLWILFFVVIIAGIGHALTR